MKKIIFCILILLVVTISFSQQNNLSPIASKNVIDKETIPIWSVRLNTIAGTLLNGLLLYANDSVMAIYPGNWNDWKHKENYQTVFFSFNMIGKIQLKKKGLFAAKKEFVVNGNPGEFKIFKESIQ